MSPEEFDAIEPTGFEGGYRYEVINGVLVVTPPVGAAEADPNDELGFLLRTYRGSHPQGQALDATMPERTVPGTPHRRRCDRAVWAGLGRLPETSCDVPAIVIEFVSVSRSDALRDYEQKRDEYLEAGVKEYWIIDRFRRIMTVYRPGLMGPTYQVVAESQTYRTDLLPGFELPLARLLGRADLWIRQRKRTAPKPSEPKPAGETDG
jgi:Uma2 family endonuclease